MQAEDGFAQLAAQGGAGVVDGVVWQTFEPKPLDLVAFVWFGVGWFANPVGDLEEDPMRAWASASRWWHRWANLSPEAGSTMMPSSSKASRAAPGPRLGPL